MQKNCDMERRRLNPIICSLAALLMTCAAFHQTAGAQEYVAPPVSISKDKVKIDGKVFYSHIVLEKQTLFSISKAYDVSIEDIYRYNPDIKENGLRKNDIINIPVINKSPNKKDKDKEDEVINQTQPERIKHTVKWYEDLSSIAEKYHVTEDAIVKANGLKDKKVKSRQVLIIPEMDEQTDFTVNTEPNVINDEAAEVKEDGTYDDSVLYYSQTFDYVTEDTDYIAVYSEKTREPVMTFWNLIEMIFSKFNMIFEYFSKIFG